jgi:hypothetical protein
MKSVPRSLCLFSQSAEDANQSSVKVNLPTGAITRRARQASYVLFTSVGPLPAGSKHDSAIAETASLPSSITCRMPIRGADDTDPGGHRKLTLTTSKFRKSNLGYASFVSKIRLSCSIVLTSFDFRGLRHV